jgi:DNA (cytosine-5)-methyltransferase 1
MENKKIRYLSVCSGMEAATVAWHHMGWTPVGFSEIEPFPSQILKHHYPTIPNYGDLTKFKEWPIERGAIDLLVGGTPCQAFSVAGLRQGLADPRGNLALTFLALADHLRPKYILWENVPGVLSSSGGEDFASFISALAELRYGFAWRMCDAQYFGVPQRRKRVFLLAIEGAGNWRTAAEILFERKSLFGDIEESDETRQKITTDAGSSIEPNGILWSASDQPNAERLIDKAGTLNCNKGQRGGYICPTVIGSLCARDFKGVGNQYVQEGKCIVEPVPFRKSKRATSTTDHETWVEANSSNTLNNFDLGDTRTTHAVVYENNRRDGLRTYEGTSPTLQSFMGTGGGNIPLVNQEVYSIREDAKANNFSATPLEVTPALQALRPSVQSHHAQAFVAQPMAVRRLTPVECERLQGFPDNYSQIEWNNKPASECPDGPRYKACGNSMAVPVMRWIGERIQKQIDGTL